MKARRDPGDGPPPPERVEDHPAAVLSWVHEAGNPYFDWIFGGAERSRAMLSNWLGRPSSEVSLTRVTFGRDGDRVVGGYIAMDGATLRSCRRADLGALLHDVPVEDRPALLERLALTRSLFAPVDEEAYYLSKIGVHPGERGQDHGRALLEHFVATGKEKGFRRFRLDVSADNEPACALYLRVGFRVVHESRIAGADLHYRAMLLEATS